MRHQRQCLQRWGSPRGEGQGGRWVFSQFRMVVSVGGVEVWAAQHPYTATQSNLRAYALPRWASAGGQEEIMRRFTHPDDATNLARWYAEVSARPSTAA